MFNDSFYNANEKRILLQANSGLENKRRRLSLLSCFSLFDCLEEEGGLDVKACFYLAYADWQLLGFALH